MTEDTKLKGAVALVQKWARLNQTPYSIEDKKAEAVQDFSNEIIAKLKENIDDKEELNRLIKKISSYSDLFKLQYVRTSFMEKLTRSKKNPQIQYLKDTLTIFDELSDREAYFTDSFCWQLQVDASFLENQVRERRQEIQKPTPVTGEKFDEDGDYLPDRLALVHVTKYKPQKNEDGCYVMETTAQVTDYRFPRNTLHFAINHHVESHMDGNWDDKPYVIVAPMKATMDKNGKPVYIDSRDTFFDFGVDEKMVLPEETHLFEPATKKLPEGTLWVTNANRTIYKTTGFTEKDVEFLTMVLFGEKRRNFDEIKDPSEREKFLAVLSKKRALNTFLKDKGYAYIYSHHTEHDSHENIPEIANMAEKMGVAGGRDDGHAYRAMSGSGSPLYDFFVFYDRLIADNEQILNAKKIVKKDDNNLVVDGEEMVIDNGYRCRFGISENASNVKDYCENWINGCFTRLKEECERIPDMIPSKRKEGLKKFEQIEQQNLPFQQRFFAKVDAFWSRSFTPKEQEVFMAWIDKTQQRVDDVVRAIDGRTLDEIIQSKSTSTSASPQATGAMLRGGGR